jgi:hypothetical protein
MKRLISIVASVSLLCAATSAAAQSATAAERLEAEGVPFDATIQPKSAYTAMLNALT